MASRFLTVVDDAALAVRVEFWEGCAFIHTTFRRRVQAMREARKRIFPQLKLWLRGMGHEHSYVCVDPADHRLYRFARLFGFRDLCFFGGYRVLAVEN